MTVYEAIHPMRRLTNEGRPFALSYMTYSVQRRESHGEVACEHALLVKNQKPDRADGFTPSDFMLTYRDQDTGEARHFWQPLLMSFNHQPLTSID